MAGTTLKVTMLADLVESGGEPVTFGRQGDLVVDEANRFLHRIVGRFVRRDGLWWLQNHCRRGALRLESEVHGARIEVRPGGQVPVPGGSFVVTFTAGQANYELECWADVASTDGSVAWGGGGTANDPDGTLDFGRIPLTAEQHLLCVALAARRLAGDDGLPTNHEVAAALGWSITKLNRKLDYVCARFDRAGVAGLRGAPGDLATDRRRVLVDHLLGQQLVTVEDLGLVGALGTRRAIG